VRQPTTSDPAPSLDEDRLPREEPMNYDQATLATRLGSALRQHRDERRLPWHVGVNDAVDFRAEGEPRPRRVFPDLFALVGLAQLPPGILRTWTLQRAPDVACEYSTADSIAEDRTAKRALYERALAVPEYFVFDVEAVAIPGLLEGWRLDAQGEYRPIPRVPTPTKAVRLHSERLGLDLEVVPYPFVAGRHEVRAFLPGSRAPLLTAEEELALREKAEAVRAAVREKDEALREALARLAALEAAHRPPPATDEASR
jgi:Uma2 family endonuclease